MLAYSNIMPCVCENYPFFIPHHIWGVQCSCNGHATSLHLCCNRPIHIRAQRKFASSSSVASSPCGSVAHNRAVSSPSDWSAADQSPLQAVRKSIAGRRVTTDDFLTFLCLRGLTSNYSIYLWFTDLFALPLMMYYSYKVCMFCSCYFFNYSKSKAVHKV